jgi:ribosomal protein S3
MSNLPLTRPAAELSTVLRTGRLGSDNPRHEKYRRWLTLHGEPADDRPPAGGVTTTMGKLGMKIKLGFHN